MSRDLAAALRPALVLTLLFATLLGIAYPLVLTGAGQLLFPDQANGSLLRDERGVARGSALIGQSFADPAYFSGRPSAAGEGYDALASAGSNLGPNARALADRMRADVTALRTSPGQSVPADLVTTSASGLDPHISPEAAFFQVARVAAARGADPAAVRALVARHVERPALGFIGEARVTVLALNRDLDRTYPRP